MREGIGSFKQFHDDTYENIWDKKKREGKSLLKFMSGNIYKGEWKKNLKNG